MSTPSRSITHLAKTILCVGLTLNLPLWTLGCGNAPAMLPDGFMRFNLPGDQMLAVATQDAATGQAQAIEIDANHTTSAVRIVIARDRVETGR